MARAKHYCEAIGCISSLSENEFWIRKDRSCWYLYCARNPPQRVRVIVTKVVMRTVLKSILGNIITFVSIALNAANGDALPVTIDLR